MSAAAARAAGTRRDPATLRPVFEPQAVALVGASPDFTRYGGRALHFLSGFGFAGPIWPVNPKYPDIRGTVCYPNLKALPGRPDHVGIVVAPERVLSVLEECAEVGVKAVTVFSAGFAEQGNAESTALQDRLSDFVRGAGIRMVGPNCNGVINWKHRFSMSATAALLEPAAKPGCVGVVSQSGGLGQINIMWRAIRAGLGISYQASCGNEADIDTFDVVDFMIDDPDTRIILMAVEAIRDGAKMRAVADRARSARKPILMLKLGRSQHGRRAAASHTGAMTGADEVHDAALAQAGILRVDDPEHLYQAALLFQQGRALAAEGVASVSVSGGCLALVADQAERFGLVFPGYSQRTVDALADVIPGFITISNPTDLSVEVLGKPGGLKQVLDAVAADPAIGVMLPMLTMTPRRDLDIFLDFARNAAKPTALIWSGGCTDQPMPVDDGIIEGVPVFRDIDTALRATGLLVRYGAFVRKADRRHEPRRPVGIDTDRARRLLAAATGRTLTERQSKEILAAYGLRGTREALATRAEEALEHFRTIGAPIAMKIEAPEITHKSDVGGVRLDVTSEPEVVEAFASILQAARAAHPATKLNGVLVQEMIPAGIEIILGCSTDPSYGPVIALGLGGIFAEFMGKPVLRLPPLTDDEAREMIDALPQRGILDGVRGRPSADVAVLAQVIVRFSWLVADLAADIAEIDVNPLILRGSSATAVDALIVRSQEPVSR